MAFAALVLLAPPAFGQADGVEISGLVIDRTLTRGGREFFSAVSKQLDPLDDRPFTIEIQERIAPGRSTFVRLYVDQSLIFQASLDPLPGRIEETARRAIGRLAHYVARREAQRTELEQY